MNIWKTTVSGKPLVLGVPVIITVTVFCGSSTIFQKCRLLRVFSGFILTSHLCRIVKMKLYIHSCSILSYDRFKAYSKVSSPHSVI